MKATLAAALMILHLTVGANPVKCPAPQGIVAWWRGETGCQDCVGFSHGTLAGGAKIVPAKVGNGFGFRGSGSVTIPHTPTLSFTKALTIELWFRTDSTNICYYGLASKRTPYLSTANYGINFVPNVGLGPYYNDPFVTGLGDEKNDFETPRYLPGPECGEFHHLAATYSQDSPTHIRLQVFINGQLVRAQVLPGAMSRTINTAPFVIGTTYGSPGESFIGVIDEVTLYNRVLTAEEIRTIYAADGGKTLP